MENRYDFIVIGSGPAGRRGAIQAAKAGQSVLIVDKGRDIGGVCVHTGTVPSKTLRETVLNLSGWRERGFYGSAYKVKANISAADLKKRLLMTIEHEVNILDNQFDRNHVTRMQGTARFISRDQISLTTPDGEIHHIEFGKILLAVGTKPFRPDYIPFDGKSVLDCDDILDLQSLPRSLTVIGAGVIGLEYASIFNALDIPVTVVEPRKTVLDFLDADIVEDFLHDLRKRGVRMCLGVKAKQIKNDGKRCFVKLADGRIIESSTILFAAGRIGSTDELGLDACGLDVDHRGRIAVNRKTFETKVPNIYAAGDIIGFPSLASTSMEQGRIAACHALDIPKASPPDYFPYGIYAVPEISTIGLTEKEVRAANLPYQVGIARLRETSRGQIMGIQGGLMKMVFSLESRQLLGVHIIGEGATELIHIGQAVLNLNGKLDYFINNIFNYPTLAEAYKIAALDAWNKMRNISLEDEEEEASKSDVLAGVEFNFEDLPNNPFADLKSA